MNQTEESFEGTKKFLIKTIVGIQNFETHAPICLGLMFVTALFVICTYKFMTITEIY